MAAYPGAVGSGKVTIAFRGYNQSLHDGLFLFCVLFWGEEGCW